MLRVFILLLIFSYIYGCGYKPVNLSEKKLRVCVDNIHISSAEATVLDILNKKLRDSIVAQGKKMDCSYKRDVNLYITEKSLSFYPIGYSESQRANVYKIGMTINLKVENKEGKTILNKDITETTQYVGSGLRADIEKRYAIERLADLLEVRIFSILSEI